MFLVWFNYLIVVLILSFIPLFLYIYCWKHFVFNLVGFVSNESGWMKKLIMILKVVGVGNCTMPKCGFYD